MCAEAAAEDGEEEQRQRRTEVGLAETFGYNAVAFGLPIIIATLMTQGPLTTIASSFALNLVFALTGGLLGIRWASTRGAWPMMTLGFAIQFVAITALGLIGDPSGTAVVTAGILMLGAFMFAQGFGPGAHIMSYASLGFPTAAAGRRPLRAARPPSRRRVVGRAPRQIGRALVLGDEVLDEGNLAATAVMARLGTSRIGHRAPPTANHGKAAQRDGHPGGLIRRP